MVGGIIPLRWATSSRYDGRLRQESATPPDERSLSRALEAFLDGGDPPVYVGFGSTGEVDADTTTRLSVESLQIAGRTLLGKCDASTARMSNSAASRIAHPLILAIRMHHQSLGSNI